MSLEPGKARATMRSLNMTQRFDERVAIVTGGGSGIGEAIALRLAAEGGRVIVFDREPAAVARGLQHAL